MINNNPDDISKREEEALKDERAADITVDLNLEPDDQPTVSAGLTHNQLGANAKPSQASTIEVKPNAQALGDQERQEQSEYGFDAASQQKQYNDAMSGAAEGKTNTSLSANASRIREIEEEKKRDTIRNGLALAAYDAQMQLESLMDSLDDLIQQRRQIEKEIEESMKALDNLVTGLKATGNYEDAKIVEDVIEMKDYVVIDYQGQERIVYADRDADGNDTGVRYVLDDEGERVYINEMKDGFREKAWADIYAQEGQKTGDQDPQRAKEIEDSYKRLHSPEKQGLLTSVEEANNAQWSARQKLLVIDQQISAKEQEIKSYVEQAGKDGTLTQEEIRIALSKIDDVEGDSAYKAEVAQNVAASIVASGATVLDGNNQAVESAGIEQYVMNQYADLIASKQAELDQTQGEIQETNKQIDAVNAKIQESSQALAASTETLTTLTTTGSADDIAAAKIGAATVGENQSLATRIITDIDGNEVYIDRSNPDAVSYYHMDANGERVDYAANDPQVMNFDMGKNGGEPFASSSPMSSSSPLMSTPMQSSSPMSSQRNNSLDSLLNPTREQSPSAVMVFANDKVNSDAYQAQFEQKDATKVIAASEQELVALSGQIDQLKNQEGMLVADIQQIENIQSQVTAGTLSLADAQDMLKQFDQNDTDGNETAVASTEQATEESLTLDTPSVDPYVAEENLITARNELIQAVYYSGGVITEEQKQELLELDGVSENDLKAMMEDQGITVAKIPENTNWINLSSVLDQYGEVETHQSDPTPEPMPYELIPDPEDNQAGLNPDDPKMPVPPNNDPNRLVLASAGAAGM